MCARPTSGQPPPPVATHKTRLRRRDADSEPEEKTRRARVPSTSGGHRHAGPGAALKRRVGPLLEENGAEPRRPAREARRRGRGATRLPLGAICNLVRNHRHWCVDRAELVTHALRARSDAELVNREEVAFAANPQKLRFRNVGQCDVRHSQPRALLPSTACQTEAHANMRGPSARARWCRVSAQRTVGSSAGDTAKGTSISSGAHGYRCASKLCYDSTGGCDGATVSPRCSPPGQPL